MSGWLWRAALVLALALPAAARAQPAGVPEALRGAWFSGACEDPDAMLALTGRAAARLDAAQPARLFRFRELREIAGWRLGVATGAEAPRLLFRATAGGLETAEPDPKTRDDRLPGDALPTAWQRCATPPAALLLLHGEGIAVLAALEAMEAGCAAAPPAACAAAIVRDGDVSGDGRLSPAELARLARGAAWIAAVQEGAMPDALAGVVGAAALGGVLAARLLVESLDYDGDGRLSAAELAQDRAGFGAAGTAAGRPLALDGLVDGALALRALVDGLLGGR